MRKLFLGIWILAIIGLGGTACAPSVEETDQPATEVPPTTTPEEVVSEPTTAATEEETNMSFEITSEAFGEGESIPVRYTCDGENLSPALAWGEPPDGTESLVLIMDDPDAPAGTWVHWVLFNLPPGQGWLEEGVAAEAESSDGSRHGSNSWGQLGYGGPCPPSGTHRYFFHLYALDSDLDLDPGSTKEQVLAEAEPHVLGQTELLGTFAR